MVRALGLGLVWGSLGGWASRYAVYGAVGVTVATGFSLLLLPPRGEVRFRSWPKRVWFTLVLVGWFLGKSALGGVDVAVRALRKPVNIAPVVVEAPVVLPDGHGRQLALLMMTLMPGTMVQRVISGSDSGAGAGSGAEHEASATVELHALAESLRPAEQWAQLQGRVAAAVGVRI